MTGKHYLGAILVLFAACWAASADEVRGVISRFDVAKRELVIEGRGRRGRGVSFAFSMAPDAEVLVGRKPGELADLKPGTRVSVLFESRDGRKVAVGVTVHGALIREAMKAAPLAPDASALSGKLIRVAKTDREVVVVSPGAGGEIETTFTVPKDATITRDQKPIGLEDLKEGEQVVVRGETRDGKRMARSIQAGVAASPQRADQIERLRRLLRLADQLLEMAQQREQNKP